MTVHTSGMAPLAKPTNWLHSETTAHAIRRTDWDVWTAWCGFTFTPKPGFQPLTQSSNPCEPCARARRGEQG